MYLVPRWWIEFHLSFFSKKLYLFRFTSSQDYFFKNHSFSPREHPCTARPRDTRFLVLGKNRAAQNRASWGLYLCTKWDSFSKNSVSSRLFFKIRVSWGYTYVLKGNFIAYFLVLFLCVLNQNRLFYNRKGCSKTEKGHSKTEKDVPKQENDILKQKEMF